MGFQNHFCVVYGGLWFVFPLLFLLQQFTANSKRDNMGIVFDSHNRFEFIKSGALRGLHKIVLGQLPEYTLVPGFFILFILILKSISLPDLITPLQAIQSQLAATFVAFFLIGTIIHNRSTLQSNSSKQAGF